RRNRVSSASALWTSRSPESGIAGLRRRGVWRAAAYHGRGLRTVLTVRISINPKDGHLATIEEVRAALRSVLDPEINRPIEDIGMLREIEVDGGTVRVHVLITIEGCPLKERIEHDVTQAVMPLAGVERVEVPL